MSYSKRIFGLFIPAVFSLLLTGCGSGGGSLALPVSNGFSTVNNTAPVQTVAQTGKAACSDTTYSPNFAAGTDPASGLPNQLFHWNHFPVKVCVIGGSLATPDRVAQAEAGFNWWVQSTNGLVSYQIVSLPSQADITLQFSNDGLNGEGGVTNYTESGGVMQHADITLNMTYLSSVASISPPAAHEFGHALGIDGHSTVSTDVMSESPNVYNLTALSQRDVNTLLTAYCGITTRDAARSYGSLHCTLGH